MSFIQNFPLKDILLLFVILKYDLYAIDSANILVYWMFARLNITNILIKIRFTSFFLTSSWLIRTRLECI